MDVEALGIELGGEPVRLRRAPAAGPVVPLLVHGLPGDSGDWADVLALSGGIAPDLLGFGASSKGAHLDFSPAGQAGFLLGLLDHLDVDRVALAAHGWGTAVALAVVEAAPERVERLALCSPPGRSRLAAALRRRVAGELMMGLASRRLLERWYRRGEGGCEAWPEGRPRAVWEAFDLGTQRAILRFLRAAGAGAGAEALAPHLARALRERPALLLTGTSDPWAPEPGDLPPGGERVELPTGHWPWLHPPGARRLADFLGGAGHDA